MKPSDFREHLNVVFIGHVDAGKSTLSGSMLYHTGMVDQRTIDKYEREAKSLNRESWFLAFIMDTNDEERSKGKTVEVGRAEFNTDDRRFTVLDAPGHKSYVPNMIQGASQADVGVLVISARRGEFETGFERGGQTREHTLLAKTLGIRHLVVVVNKMDESTVLWSKERYDEIVQKLGQFLKKSGFKRAAVNFVPVSAMTGEGVKDPVPAATAGWAAGMPSLLQILNGISVPGRDAKAPLRMPVLDRITDRGVIAMGKVETGTLYVGQRVVIAPMGTRAKVDSIRVGLDEENFVEAAFPGDNVQVKLKGVSEEDVHKGFVVSDAGMPCTAPTRFQAQLQLMDLDYRNVFSAGYSAILHIHTAAEECTVAKIVKSFDSKGKERPGAKFAKSNETCVVNIELERSTPLEKYETTQQLGRFTLRDEGRTIAIGKVTGVPKSAYDTAASWAVGRK